MRCVAPRVCVCVCMCVCVCVSVCVCVCVHRMLLPRACLHMPAHTPRFTKPRRTHHVACAFACMLRCMHAIRLTHAACVHAPAPATPTGMACPAHAHAHATMSTPLLHPHACVPTRTTPLALLRDCPHRGTHGTQHLLLTFCDGMVAGISGFSKGAMEWAAMPGRSRQHARAGIGMRENRLQRYSRGGLALTASSTTGSGSGQPPPVAGAGASGRVAAPGGQRPVAVGVYTDAESTVVLVEQLRYDWQVTPPAMTDATYTG